MNKFSSNYRENTPNKYFLSHQNKPLTNTLCMHLYCIQLTTGIFKFCLCFAFVLTRQQNQKVRQAEKVGEKHSKTHFSLYSSISMSWKNTGATTCSFSWCLSVSPKHDNVVNDSRCMKATRNVTPVGSWQKRKSCWFLAVLQKKNRSKIISSFPVELFLPLRLAINCKCYLKNSYLTFSKR